MFTCCIITYFVHSLLDNSASRKRGVSASPGTDQSTDVAKVKQDAYTPKKYDGFGGALGSTNVNEVINIISGQQLNGNELVIRNNNCVHIFR